jgi:pimeloyl-ACP methyl ester carboxylesterase/DNA-binding CsgD family transcriptional regulator
MDSPLVQYVTTGDGYSIAYCVSGEGPPLVLMPEPWNHLSLMWSSPVYRSLYEPLAERYRLIQFDLRGSGLSQREVPRGSDFYDMTLDLEAVTNCLGIGRFALYGSYTPGHIAAYFASQHPERVEALVLWNIGLTRPPELNVLLRELQSSSWDLFVETMARTFQAYEDTKMALTRMKAAMRQEDFALRLESFASLSSEQIHDALRSIRVPTLVVASRTARLSLEEQGKQIAAMVPDSRLVFFDDGAGGRFTNDGSTPGLVQAIADFIASVQDRGGAGALVSPPRLEASDSLSSRELEVLRLLAQGKTNPEIAKELFITRNTVQNHVSSILIKTNLTNRAQAAVYAQQRGLR